MLQNKQYDIAIIGGGLAGLALSIQAAKLGLSVVLFEKETYPFHKVCGEYISLESWDFIESLGVPLSDMQLPIIKNLMVSSPNGNNLLQTLPLGGFGISRFMLDDLLKNIAIINGIVVNQNCKVDDVAFNDEIFTITTTNEVYKSKICCGSFGKRSNLDVKWKRFFTTKKATKLNNYIGVKYHINTIFKNDTIALHNFKDGYCGISKIENDKYCLCYLTTAKNLKDNNNSIKKMEETVLYQNPFLKNIFTNSEIIYDKPVVISQISFAKKSQIENHVILLGDAAGMITPLCGNGMSMALLASKIACSNINQYLQNKINRTQLEENYTKEWKINFKKRLKTGRFIQQLFGKVWVTNLFIGVMKKNKKIVNWLVEQTHGKPF